AFSTRGDAVAWVLDGQIWFLYLSNPEAKPAQLLHTMGTSGTLRWSPDGTALAFVSDRISHSFIGVYSFATNTLEYLDPGSDHDRYPMWSPDSRQIAFVRVPYYKQENFDEPHRTGLPWSIRLADVATGFGRPIQAQAVFSARSLAPNRCSGPRMTISSFPGSAMVGHISTQFRCRGERRNY